MRPTLVDNILPHGAEDIYIIFHPPPHVYESTSYQEIEGPAGKKIENFAALNWLFSGLRGRHPLIHAYYNDLASSTESWFALLVGVSLWSGYGNKRMYRVTDQPSPNRAFLPADTNSLRTTNPLRP